jgi:hypothetical protein
MMFTRALWKRSPFPEVAVGEDTRFVWRAPANRVVPGTKPVAVGIVHRGNTVHKSGVAAYWAPQPADAVERLIGEDLDYYRPAARNAG